MIVHSSAVSTATAATATASTITEVSIRELLPGDHHVAGPVGEPDRADREQADDQEIDDDADHRVS